ncbi:hypothetical protein [Thiorhodovibrio litoralis]|uniref:hypothetical protein n=1 Tax=Thiorhodovibrio litoralis TaxID=2952932 RepID=UPI002B25F929|nr:hypothetical protein [Thiorhodovibrio litoralis]WPL14156.1 hypothetical protein Thiosp_03989 [Thiorhodovibrio litoralis]
MVDQITPVLAEATAVQLLGFADRRLAGKTLRHWPIVGPEAIEHLQPGIILIVAETSGSAIYRDLYAHQGRATLVPLYDLAARLTPERLQRKRIVLNNPLLAEATARANAS